MRRFHKNVIIEYKISLQHTHVLNERYITGTLNQVEQIMLHSSIDILKPPVKEELIERVIYKHENRWFTWEEYDNFTKVFLCLYEDRAFFG